MTIQPSLTVASFRFKMLDQFPKFSEHKMNLVSFLTKFHFNSIISYLDTPWKLIRKLLFDTSQALRGVRVILTFSYELCL